MRLRLPELRLILLAVAALALLAIFALAPAAVPLPDQAHAQDSPSAAISLSPSGSVDQGTAITVSMSFDNLASDSDTSTTDYIFRADVVNADACEGGGMGKDRYFYQVDEDPETRAGEISTDCPVGDYTVRVTLSAADNTELDSATAGFTIAEPTPEPTPGPTAEPTPEPGPSGALQLSETSVNYGTPIAVTMTFRNFPDPERQPDRAEFRGDVVGADECEGAGLGHTRYIYPGDADPAVRSGTISALCPPGTYTIAASLVSHEGVRIIDTSASFLINDPTWVPAAEVLVSPGNVPAEAEGAVTLRFRDLQFDTDPATTDYIFRADVVGADDCEGDGLGVDRTLSKVDENPEIAVGTILADCPPGAPYTIEASLLSAKKVELATASARFAKAVADWDDAALSGLTVNSGRLAAFAPDRTTYRVGVAYSVGSITVTPTARAANATITIDGTAVSSGTGHAVELGEGSGADIALIKVKVNAQDLVTSKSYYIHVDRGVSDPSGWKAADDFNGLEATGNSAPAGIWSDGATMWVVDGFDDKVYAYSMTTGERLPDEEFDLDPANQWPGGLWSDGETFWVPTRYEAVLYAYNRSTGARDVDKEFFLRRHVFRNFYGKGVHRSRDVYAKGVWSDGTTIWVVDDPWWEELGEGLIAFNLANGRRDPAKDITTLAAAGNQRPSGVWSDEVTIWVSDYDDDRVYAYNLKTGERDPSQDIETVLGRTLDWLLPDASHNIWSDGETMYVAYNRRVLALRVPGDDFSKIYSFNIPTSHNADLGSLGVEGGSLIGPMELSPAFDSGVTAYSATKLLSQADSVTVTVLGAPAHHAATVAITPADADENTEGHQVTLTPNVPTSVTIKVTAKDGVTAKTYTLALAVMAPTTRVVLLELGLADSDSETEGHQVALTERIPTALTVTITDGDGKTATYTVQLSLEDLVVSGGD